MRWRKITQSWEEVWGPGTHSQRWWHLRQDLNEVRDKHAAAGFLFQIRETTRAWGESHLAHLGSWNKVGKWLGMKTEGSLVPRSWQKHSPVLGTLCAKTGEWQALAVLSKNQVGHILLAIIDSQELMHYHLFWYCTHQIYLFATLFSENSLILTDYYS